MKFYYRISDGSYKKERFADKHRCLANFLITLNPTQDEFVLIADNVGQETKDMIRKLHQNPIETSLGSGAASWRFAAELAMQENDDEQIYFVEDDYLHLPGSRKALNEAFGIADYISLYDHPDKYLDASLGGNPYVSGGGEITRVFQTESCHWKLTNSTTMTFATTPKILKEDWDVWDRATAGTYPRDFDAFIELMHKQRQLVTPIPTFATHCEVQWEASKVDWETLDRI